MGKANISGSRIGEARKQKGWSQSELAAALNVDFNIELDQSDISEIERCKRGVKDFELNAIAYLLDVSPIWLLRGDKIKNNE
ncbi:MAG: helix-turn-helix transcriptional regulator [Cyanobacteriota bacterium]|nr:helix-turn-helix transcriptional regulator [Cyanobacteriota bacterium]